jgi:hypothetical protein
MAAINMVGAVYSIACLCARPRLFARVNMRFNLSERLQDMGHCPSTRPTVVEVQSVYRIGRFIACSLVFGFFFFFGRVTLAPAYRYETSTVDGPDLSFGERLQWSTAEP